MKALPQTVRSSTTFNAVRLYRDDIAAVMDIFAAGGGAVRLIDDRFEYDTIDELFTAAGRSPRKLTIEVSDKPSSSQAYLSFSGTTWYLFSDGDCFRDAAALVATLLRARQSGVDGLPLLRMVVGGAWCLILAMNIPFPNPTVQTSLVSISGALMFGSLILSLYWAKVSAIILRYPHDANFFRRNRDAVLLLLSGAAVSALAQFILSRVVKGKQ
jgi:hypothetical protein